MVTHSSQSASSGPERRLLDRVRDLAQTLAPDERVVVAFSGGLDSTVLLHALQKVGAPLSAIHIDHGWHPESAAWAKHCVAVATALGIECEVLEVEAGPDPGESPEAAARAARYAAFSQRLRPSHVLATAHHADDQLETLLMRQFRGGGVRGLRGIRFERMSGNVRVVRPMLSFTRAEVERVADRWGLKWIADPSNADSRYDRNYLRREIVPAVTSRWPGATATAVALAEHMEESESLLNDLAGIDRGDEPDCDRFPVSRLLELPMARQKNLLRHLIRLTGLPVPGRRPMAEMVRQLNSGTSNAAHIPWPGGEARVYQGLVHLLAPVPAVPEPVVGGFGPGSGWSGPIGELTLVRDDRSGLPDRLVRAGLDLRFRAGGERFAQSGRGHTKSLKQWFQEERIVPWLRPHLPLLFSGEQLVAVAGLAVAELPPGSDGVYWRPVWKSGLHLR